MEVAMHRLESIQSNMRINLSGRDVGVAQDSLDCTQIGAVFYHVRGQTMAQHMWTGMTAGRRSCLHHLPHPLSRQPATPASHKERGGNLAVQEYGTSLFQIGSQRLLSRATHWDHSF